MMERIIDLEEGTLRVVSSVLRVERGDAKPVSVDVAEVAVVILSSRTTVSGAAAVLLARAGAAMVFVDERFLPVSLTLPFSGRSMERLRLQVERLPMLAPQLWQQIVQQKIKAQAELLDTLGRTHELQDLHVALGDSTNAEATATRAYWERLFGPTFTRRDDDGVNPLLNYGYAVLRALVARAIVSQGLHPAIGIRHRDPFALASDLMEPFRPLVDHAVVAQSAGAALDKSTKRAILEAVMEAREPISAAVQRFVGESLESPW
jgi:CRISPR-associated protein Cas1